MNEKQFKKAGVYCIKNLKTGKVYIGSSQCLSKRKNEHFNGLRNNKHHCYHLQKSYNQYGEKYFLFCIIEYIQDIKQLLRREQYWLLHYNVGNHDRCYNTCLFSSATTRGLKFSEEVRVKHSKARKGKKFTESHKKHLSESNRGKKRTEEQKQRMREGNRKRGFTKAQKLALKKRNDTYKGANNPNAKKVICLDTKQIFNTIQEALIFSKGKDASNLSACCKRHKPYKKHYYLLYKEFCQMSDLEIRSIYSAWD